MSNTIYTDNWVKPDREVVLEENPESGWGMKVKNPLGEKFWVTYLNTEDDGSFIGLVDNNLILPSEYNYGSMVKFKLEDIWDIRTPKNRLNDLVYVSTMIEIFFNKYKRMPTSSEITFMGINITSAGLS